MDNKLRANPSTSRTLVIEGELPMLIVPEPMILPFLFTPNLTSPADLSTRSWNIDLFPVMCREHPESMYHDMFAFVLLAARDICNRNNLFLRYPQFLGSFFVSSPQVLIELRFSMKINRRYNMIFLSVCNM